jgi:hypothetical protein
VNNISKIFALAFTLVTVTLAIYLYVQDFRPIIYRAAENAVAAIVASTLQDEREFRLLFCGTGSPYGTDK